MAPSSTRKTGKKSPRHPLAQALLFAAKVNEQYGDTPCSREYAAAAMGHNTVSGTSDTKVGSMTHFGLLDRVSGGKYKISALALRVLMPANDQDKKDALAEAASHPSLYKSLIESYAGKALPAQLGNVLAHEYGVTPRTRDRTARNFKESVEYGGLLKNGILSAPESRDAAKPAGIDATVGITNPTAPFSGDTNDGNSQPPSPSHANSEPQQCHTVPLGLNGRMASINLPNPTSVRDLDRVIAWAQFMKGLVDETP